jgi:hypothetical protein
MDFQSTNLKTGTIYGPLVKVGNAEDLSLAMCFKIWRQNPKIK